MFLIHVTCSVRCALFSFAKDKYNNLCEITAVCWRISEWCLYALGGVGMETRFFYVTQSKENNVMREESERQSKRNDSNQHYMNGNIDAKYLHHEIAPNPIHRVPIHRHKRLHFVGRADTMSSLHCEIMNPFWWRAIQTLIKSAIKRNRTRTRVNTNIGNFTFVGRYERHFHSNVCIVYLVTAFLSLAKEMINLAHCLSSVDTLDN